MNRRSFLKFLSIATIGSTITYSFPSIIVPRNIISLEDTKEVYPELIRDLFFREQPDLAYLRKNYLLERDPFVGEVGFRFSNKMVMRDFTRGL